MSTLKFPQKAHPSRRVCAVLVQGNSKLQENPYIFVLGFSVEGRWNNA